MYFDRDDICEAYYQLESDYNVSGVLQERASNVRRKMSTGYQLHRMGFKLRLGVCRDGYNGLTDNGKTIYYMLELRYGFTHE